MRFIKLLSIAILFIAVSFGAKAQTISVNPTIYNSGIFSITVTSASSTVYYSVVSTTATAPIATDFAASATSVSYDAALTKTFATPTVAGSYVVYAQTSASNTSLASATFSVVVDTNAPTLTLLGTSSTTITATLSITLNEAAKVYSVISDDITATLSAAQIATDENYDGEQIAGDLTDVFGNSTTPLTQNTDYKVFAVAIDAAGNYSSVFSTIIRTESTPTVTPAYGVKLTATTKNFVATLSITSDRAISAAYYVVATATTASSVTIAKLGFSLSSTTSGTTTVTLPAGNHTISAVVIDTDGNLSTVASTTITITSIENPTIEANSVNVYPNPASDKATIAYTLTETSNVTIKLFDVAGKVVKTIENTTKGTGKYEVAFDNSDLQAGVYVYQIVTKEGTVSKQFVVKR